MQAYAFQVGGHNTADGPPESLVDGAGRFLKKLQAGERGQREVQFYTAVERLRETGAAQHCQLPLQQQHCQQQQQPHPAGAAPPASSTKDASSSGAQLRGLQQLAGWVPRSFGVVEVGGAHYLAMEDLTGCFRQPCVLDVKVGYSTWYPWAPDSLQHKYRVKDRATTQSSLGFRLCGVLVHDASGSVVWRQDRHWGKDLTPESMGAALQRFADNGHVTLRDLCVGPGRLLEQLRALAAVFEGQEAWHFFSASLLVVYEGAARSSAEVRAQVRLIDFAHAFPTRPAAGAHEAGPVGRDQNFLDGLNSFIRELEAAVS